MFNFWQVFPMFGEYGRNQQRVKDASAKLNLYQDEIAKGNSYRKELTELEKQGGFVPTEEAALRLTTEINTQAALSGVTVTSIQPMTRQPASTGKTNMFFEEATVNVSINTGEKELIDFLYRLADKDLLIRAKSMTLGTDPSQTRLQGTLSLVKSFQRKPPPSSKTSAVAAKPAAASPSHTAQPAQPPPAQPAPVVAPPTVNTSKPAYQPPPSMAPTPAGGTNRSRRALPAPIKP
jgi:hypothetical protein